MSHEDVNTEPVYDPQVLDAAYRLIEITDEEMDKLRARVGRRMGAHLARLTETQRKHLYERVEAIVSTQWFRSELHPEAIKRIAYRFAWERRRR
jgi:cysteine synthase